MHSFTFFSPILPAVPRVPSRMDLFIDAESLWPPMVGIMDEQYREALRHCRFLDLENDHEDKPFCIDITCNLCFSPEFHISLGILIEGPEQLRKNTMFLVWSSRVIGTQDMTLLRFFQATVVYMLRADSDTTHLSPWQ